MPDFFINRKNDINYLLNCIRNVPEENKVILIKAKSGIGKSAFTKKVLQEQHYKDFIKIRLEDGGSKLSEGRLVEKMAKELDILSKKSQNVISLTDFFNNSEGSRLKKRTLTILRKAATKAIPTVGGLTDVGIDLITKSGNFDPELFFNSNITELILVLKSYIDYNLKKSKIIVNIENIQTVDSTSLELFKQIVDNSESILYLLEYTTDSLNKISENDLRNVLKGHYNSYEEKELTKLSFEDYLDVISQKGIDKKSLNLILKYTYIKFDGDLRNLTDTEVILGLDSNITSMLTAIINDDFNPRVSNILSLDENHKLILASIVAHNSEIKLEDLFYLYKATDTRLKLLDIDKILLTLENQQLISKENDSILIKHDSLTKDILNSEEYYRHIFLSYKIWSDYYYDLFKSNKFERHSRQSVLHRLFTCWSNYSPDRLFDILPDIKNVAINSIRPETAIEYIESLRGILFQNPKANDDNLNYEFLETYYYTGIFDRAYEVLNSIRETNSFKFITYKAALLNRLDRYEEAIEYCSQQLKIQHNVRFSLCLRLIQFITFRSMHDYSSCKSTFSDLMGNVDYRNFLEFGFVLRNSEILLTLEESIDNVKESIIFFENKGTPVHVGHSKITLAMLYAWSGELENGMAELKEAESILLGKTLERHIIFNDKAAISMYQRDFGTDTEEYLIEARSTATTPFDKLAISINMLIYYTETKQQDKCETIISNIIATIDDEQDLVMHRLAYYHIYWSYKKSNFQLHRHYLEKTIQIHSKLSIDDYNEYWNYRITNIEGNTTSSPSEYEFLLRYDYEPCFISYWHFEIPKSFD